MARSTCYNSKLTVFVVGLLLAGGANCADTQAQFYSFDALQLDNGGKDVDISLLEEGVQLPGIYQVDIVINGKIIDAGEIPFHLEKNSVGKPFLQACLTREQVRRYGIKAANYPALFQASNSLSRECAHISAIPQATESFQFSRRQLLLSIPQVALIPHYSGIAPRETWNDGIPAFLMNYQAGYTQSTYQRGTLSSNNLNLQLEPGVNSGAWRLRNLTTWQKFGSQKGQWQTSYTYAERGLYGIKSHLTLGERFTPSDIFDSIPFRGAMLETDDAMIPYNQREFAPIVQGVAQTQARIEVKQNGYVIYSTTVAPGPFSLAELPATTSGGDLQVTVFESDGRRQIFTVPYNTPAIALRQGFLKYNVMAGQYRPSESEVDRAIIGQATLMYGLPWNLTTYGGAQWAERYQAGQLGMGVSLGNIGALSIDSTLSHGKKWNENAQYGKTWRLRYSKSFESTNTGVALAGYQYSSSGYNSLSDVIDTYHTGNHVFYSGDFKDEQNFYGSWFNGNTHRRKSRVSLTISQPLGRWGGIYLGATRETFWGNLRDQNEFSARYTSPMISGIYWSVSLAQRKWNYPLINISGENKTDRTIDFWISIPLNRNTEHDIHMNYQMQRNSVKQKVQSIGINGYAFDRQLYWDINEQLAKTSYTQSNQDSGNFNLKWNGTYGTLNGGYGYSKWDRHMSAGVEGGVIIHQNGITLGHKLGKTTALIEVPGGSNISVMGGEGVKTDFRGYTTLSYLVPYQDNTIRLDPVTFPRDVSIQKTDVKVIPTEGAVVPAVFSSRVGARAVITLIRLNGKPVPFGAVTSIVDQAESINNTGIVGEDGEVYMTGLPTKGKIKVQWGKGLRYNCYSSFYLKNSNEVADIYNFTDVCK
ncbi:pilin outer membrane usher protein SafC [Salmonella enterica]|nr:pilin outer membrane usher protein SafC [Salmonella enterica]EBR8139496.1 pilin outer membrane usher protein SafC [Salmonella enterica subsp. enterica serovar Oranienburg]ECJ4587727.1 pilin outer membrane usher protein SafC [Salmonella enterica subsp. enterica]EAW6135404.1 pilin outer membrane usher protein SafC [Salmonella enterica]EAW9036421.1 pilin outer membrane usher protein SafC [Salmonella enterica]